MKLDPELEVQLKKYLEEKIAEKKHEVQVISAYPLNEEEIKLVKESFPSLELCRLVNTVDEKILAGLIIKLNSKVIDLSMTTQLRNFKKLFYEID